MSHSALEEIPEETLPMPPQRVMRKAAAAVREYQSGRRTGPTADEILTEWYETERYPFQALVRANAMAGDAPEPVDLPDIKSCLGCGTEIRQRENESDRNWMQRSYCSQPCYYKRNAQDSKEEDGS